MIRDDEAAPLLRSAPTQLALHAPLVWPACVLTVSAAAFRSRQPTLHQHQSTTQSNRVQCMQGNACGQRQRCRGLTLALMGGTLQGAHRRCWLCRERFQKRRSRCDHAIDSTLCTVGTFAVPCVPHGAPSLHPQPSMPATRTTACLPSCAGTGGCTTWVRCASSDRCRCAA